MSVCSDARPDWLLPVHLPFPTQGVTIATLDTDGNLTIKVNQPAEVLPPLPSRIELDNILQSIGDGKKIDAIKHYRDATRASLFDAKNAIETVMPVRPIRDAPEAIANRIWDRCKALHWAAMVDAIADAIRAERGVT